MTMGKMQQAMKHRKTGFKEILDNREAAMEKSGLSYKAAVYYLLAMVVCFWAVGQSSAYSVDGKQRGLITIKAKQPDNTVAEIELYRDSHALIIGVSQYNNGWPKLPGVVEDVKAVRKKLIENGFTVTTVMDPNTLQLRQSFENFISQYGNDLNNRLLFYFAGHGHTIQPAYGGDPIGYIVPLDAPLPKVDVEQFKRRAMSMQRIEEFARIIDSKHALFLFDSCFSGSLFALSRAVPEDISYKTAKPVRQFITSGGEDEQVSDLSIFRQQFIAGLNGEADANSDGFVTGTELSTFLQSSVINYSKGYQHPQYGKIRHPKLDKGDFVFAVNPDNLVTAAAVSQKQQSTIDPTVRTTTSSTETDALIKDLAQRYINNDIGLPRKAGVDMWTRDRSIVMVFLDVEGSGTSLGERNFIMDNASEQIRASGRYTIVEREMIDKLIAELELSNSDLADPATSLKIGRILSASLIATGSMNQQDNNWLVSLRFIDTETTSIRSSVSKILPDSDPEKVANDLGEIIAEKLKKEFPLQGKIVSLDEKSTTINIGSKSGVKKNMVFEILNEDDIPIVEIQIQKVGPSKSIARVDESKGLIREGMRVRELLND